ncbi:hypothetical protein IAT38_007363 [Cryptococcus sp. DSM 104549]
MTPLPHLVPFKLSVLALTALLISGLAQAHTRPSPSPPPLPAKTLQPLVPHRRAQQLDVANATTPRTYPIQREAGVEGGERRMYGQSELVGWSRAERRALEWDLQIAYEGETFFDGWDWFTEPDPSHGLVTYVDNNTAFKNGNAFWTSNGTAGIQVDHWSELPVNTPRDSVRITTKALFAGGLFIMDMGLMPWGCGVWPAFWTLGYEGSWPETGEIDIIEGIQSMSNNQMTVHTMPGCSINESTSGLYTGKLGQQNCDSSSGGSGCSIISDSDTSYGMNFNAAGGGVFAMLWNDQGIRMWNWNRANIPKDITAEKPDPNDWGLPVAAWDSSICDLGYYLKSQILTLNIDLCGDWAGNLYSQFSYCPLTCPEYIASPLNLNNTVMLINSLKIYQESGSVVTAQQAETNSNLTGVGGAVGGSRGGSSWGEKRWGVGVGAVGAWFLLGLWVLV